MGLGRGGLGSNGGVGSPPDASETVKGIVELATQAEVDAGTDTTRVVTPFTLANKPGGGGPVAAVDVSEDVDGNVQVAVDTIRDDAAPAALNQIQDGTLDTENLFVIQIGQSNGVGSGTNGGNYSDATQPDATPQPDVQIFNNTSGLYEDLVHNVNSKIDSVTGALGNTGGMQHAVAKFYSTHQATHANLPDKLYWFHWAYGSIALTHDKTSGFNFTKDLNPYFTGQGYDELKVHLQNAVDAFNLLADSDKNTRLVILWQQGEADTGTSNAIRDNYRGNLETVVQTVQDIFGVSDIPVISTTLSAPVNNATGKNIVNQAFLDIAQDRDGAIIDSTALTTVPVFQPDNIHYTNRSFEEMAELFIDLIALNDVNLGNYTRDPDSTTGPIAAVDVSEDLDGNVQVAVDNIRSDLVNKRSILLFDFNNTDITYINTLELASATAQGFAEEGFVATTDEWRPEVDPTTSVLSLRLEHQGNANPRLVQDLTQSDVDKMFDNGWYYRLDTRAFAAVDNQEAISLGWGLPNGGTNKWGVSQDTLFFINIVKSGSDIKIRSNSNAGSDITITNAFGNYIDLLIRGDAGGTGYDILVDGVLIGSNAIGSFTLGGTGFKDISFINAGTVSNASDAYVRSFGLLVYGTSDVLTTDETLLNKNPIFVFPQNILRDFTILLDHETGVNYGAGFGVINTQVNNSITIELQSESIIIDNDTQDIVVPPGFLNRMGKVNPVTDTTSRWETIERQLITVETDAKVNIKSFSFTDARFFGEKGSPDLQGFTLTTPLEVNVVSDIIDGVVQDVIQLNDDGANTVGAERVLTVQEWADINTFGAAYSGRSRLDTVDGEEGFFSGLQDDVPDDRYGLFFDDDGTGKMRLRGADANSVISISLDGTAGTPDINVGDWFDWTIKVPVGLAPADIIINGITMAQQLAFVTNTGGTGTKVVVSSGSGPNTNRVSYHANFGVTIYEESNIIPVVDADVAGFIDLLHMLPPGNRDYFFEIDPDVQGRPIGAAFSVLTSNLDGNISVNDLSDPNKFLINKLGTSTLKVEKIDIITVLNTVENENTYEGNFSSSPSDVTFKTFVSTSSVSQVLTAGVDTVLLFGDFNNGVISVNPTTGVFTVLESFDMLEGTVEINLIKSGGGTGLLVIWFEESFDNGVTFLPLSNSLRRKTIGSDSDGVETYDVSLPEKFTVGNQFRILGDNDGAGTITVSAPPSFITNAGPTVDGNATKIAVRT